MKYLNCFICFFLMFFLSSCLFESAGTLHVLDNGVEKVTGTIETRELINARLLKNRDDRYVDAFKESGISMEYASVDLGNGSIAWLPKKISVRGTPEFRQKLLPSPKDHRAWDTLDNTVDAVGGGFLHWILGTTFGKAVDGAQAKYYGDYARDSYNPVTEIPPEVLE